jgi:hypothetical protein
MLVAVIVWMAVTPVPVFLLFSVSSVPGAARKLLPSPHFIASAFPQVCSVLSEPLHAVAAFLEQLHVAAATLVQLHVAAAVWVQPRVVALVSEQLRAVALISVQLRVVEAVALEQLRVVAPVVVQPGVAALVSEQLRVVAPVSVRPRALAALLERSLCGSYSHPLAVSLRRLCSCVHLSHRGLSVWRYVRAQPHVLERWCG